MSEQFPGAQWYPDPTGRHEQRWWDGSQWTGRVTDQGREATDMMHVPQGWHCDEVGQLRWWDGSQWGRLAAQESAATPPPSATRPPPVPAATRLSPRHVAGAAKARRPWYAKKGYWALGAVAVLLIGTSVGQSDTGTLRLERPADQNSGNRGGSSRNVTAAEFGDLWPLSVPEGTLMCDGYAVLFRSGGVTYTVNGTAQTMARTRHYEDIDPIWLANPDGSTPKKDIGPLINSGLELCE